MVGRLLVEVILPALAENCSREEHARPVGGGQRIDELSGLCGGKMLGDLEALHQVKLPGEADWRCKVDSVKVFGVDQQATFVDVRSIDPVIDASAATQTLRHAAYPHPNSTTLRTGMAAAIFGTTRCAH